MANNEPTGIMRNYSVQVSATTVTYQDCVVIIDVVSSKASDFDGPYTSKLILSTAGSATCGSKEWILRLGEREDHAYDRQLVAYQCMR